jgi:DNA-binding response OmpR family regulator
VLSWVSNKSDFSLFAAFCFVFNKCGIFAPDYPINLKSLKKKVLIIENDELIRDIVTFILEAEGYEVSGVKYAPEAVDQLAADLILIDEWINRKEGHMLCKEIKSIAHIAHVPVIIFSTANDITDIVKVCGADGYIQKPFDIDVLLTEIRKFLPLNLQRAAM